MRLEKAERTGLILKWSKRLRWGLILAVLSYLGVCLNLWATQQQHIFEPSPQLQTTPKRIGLNSEEVRIPSGTGKDRGDLFAWWIPSKNNDTPTLLYLHGNENNIGTAHDMGKAAQFHEMGYNLLLLEYRGYGKSSGAGPNESSMYEDAEAAWMYLIKERTRNPKTTFIYGHSMGGAVAIDLAVHHPNAGGVITESTFTSMKDMGEREYPYLPVDLLLKHRFDSIGKIRLLKIPLLVIHGTWDARIPYQMSQRLFESAQQPKYLKLIEGGEHINCDLVAPLEYRAAVTEFIQRDARNTDEPKPD